MEGGPTSRRDTSSDSRPSSGPVRRRRWAWTALGVALIWGALGALGYVAGWQLHAHRANGTLVDAAQSLVHHARSAKRIHHAPAACVVGAPQSGQLAGLLSIPAIDLTAPVEEGTTDAVLSVAVGHDASSVWPGEDGTAAFLAHDVSYFVHLGSLKAGDVVLYRTACSTTRFVVSRMQVVAQGTSLHETAAPSLVLDTCYPPNALFFTSERLLVWAKEAPGGGAGAGENKRATIRVPASDRVSYSVPAPAALVAQGLTLEQNEAPMGTMTLEGATSGSWAQSPGPMALEGAALEAYFGGLHASAQQQASWWKAITVPGVAMPGTLAGGQVSGNDAPLDVEIVSAHDVPVEVVLTTVITLRGGSAPGTYAESVTASVRGGEVVLSAWSLRPDNG
jgi:sortase A